MCPFDFRTWSNRRRYRRIAAVKPKVHKGHYLIGPNVSPAKAEALKTLGKIPAQRAQQKYRVPEEDVPDSNDSADAPAPVSAPPAPPTAFSSDPWKTTVEQYLDNMQRVSYYTSRMMEAMWLHSRISKHY